MLGIREGANSFINALENEIIQTRTDMTTAVDDLGQRVNAGFARQQEQINQLRDGQDELRAGQDRILEILTDLQRRLPPAAQ